MTEYDLIIRGGTIVDGTGSSRYVGDIAIAEGRIARIGDVGDATASEEIDASGLIVAPGVIDPHTHYDAQVYWDPYCTNSGWHGVTSVVVGNCGFGFSPVRPEDREFFMQMMESTEQIPADVLRVALPWDWVTYPEWIESMKRIPKGINIGAFLPLNSLMIWVMGKDAAGSRPATEDERAEMRRLLHEAMDAGALGFGFSFLQESNSHKQPDGSPMATDVMDIEEACNLARVLCERGEGVIQALVEVPMVDHKAEVEELARISGRPVLHTVIMAIDAMPSFHQDQLVWLDEMEAKGLRVYAQALAMRGWNEMVLKDWDVWVGVPIFAEFQASGDVLARAAKAADPDFRKRLRAAYRPEIMIASGGPIETYILSNAVGYDRLTPYEGQNLGTIAEALSEPVTDVLMDLMAETKLEAEVKLPAPMSMNLDYNEAMMRHPRVLPGTSDGGAHPKFWSGGQYGTDLISWLVRDNGRLTLEEMHHKLSGVPAEALGLDERGTLTEGKAADLYVYDYDLIDYDQGRYDVVWDLPNGDWRRIARARGIKRILVNGKVTFIDNECTGATPGQVLTTMGQLAPT